MFCETIGLKEMGDNPSYDTNIKRVDHRKEIDRSIQEKILEKSTEEWITIFDEKGFPSGPVNTLDEVFDDLQVLDREVLERIDHPRYGRIKTIKLPYSFTSFKCNVRGPAPLLGEHSRDVLCGTLGYGEEKISQLIANQVIKTI